MAGLFSELTRRNVVRVGIAYVVVGWVVVQIAQLLFEAFGTPDWVIKTVIVLIALGFPFALLFAWAFELTPEGLKKTREVDLSRSITHNTGRKLDFVIIAALVIALGYFIWERQTYQRPSEAVTEPVAEGVETPEPAPQEQDAVEPGQRSIAVLPFVNMSSDQEQEYFADGLTEEILNSLAKTPDLLVAARTSSFGFKDSTQPIPEIATALGVDHVLEGSVRRGGDTLRITAQLIRAADGFHLWSETFDRTKDDIIAIQEEIAISIAKALQTAMDPEALEDMMSVGTTSIEAYEQWLLSYGFLRAFGASGDRYELINARESLEKAIEIDPTFSQALGRLSFFWTLQLASNQIGAGMFDLSRDEMRARRDELIDRAIDHESDPVTRLLLEAGRALNGNDFRRAIRYYDRYREARPNVFDADGLGGHSFALGAVGQYEELSTLMRRTYESTELTRELANQFAMDLRQEDDREFSRVISAEAVDKFGEDAGVMYQVHRLQLWAGDIDGAARILPRIQTSNLPLVNKKLAELRQLCADQRTSEAAPLLDEIVELSGDDHGRQWLAYSILGDDDAAHDAFQKLLVSTDPDGYLSFLSYANFDPTRYPEFMAQVPGQGIEDREVIDLPYRCIR